MTFFQSDIYVAGLNSKDQNGLIRIHIYISEMAPVIKVKAINKVKGQFGP